MSGMTSERERESRNELFRLMQENPDLPVLPMVDGDLSGDDFGYWLGAWGNASLNEYLMPRKDYQPIMFKSDDDVFDTLERYLPAKEFAALPESDAECRKIYDSLPWVKAIIVYIELPEPPKED